ncbi:hypothetical protein [Blastococcus saxobsidens]|uniref:Uncharacterized protein n=1 Tax=Blastococcus saxobsidens TaxID=138336 RepID=A0A4Q7Y7U5_9ACTN|nr:hypothetical protein [Blastococcus saxobsidens]RZU32045.1 hypothetical protein BKA19_1734 [Blastococcus saxobsidens]
MPDDFERELQARLAVIEDPTYDDPARADLPARDLVVLAVLGVLTIVAMIVWSYPA